MEHAKTLESRAVHLFGPTLAMAALLLLPGLAQATPNKSGWSINFTPVIMLPDADSRLGGGADPELKYTLDLGGARLSAGARVSGHYAKNLFGVTVMPTLRLMMPVGPVEPYVAFGMGYGWLPSVGYGDFATMSRLIASSKTPRPILYALGQGAGTQAIVLLPWMLSTGESGGWTRDVLMTLAWAINIVVAELLIRRQQPARTGEAVFSVPSRS